MPDPVSSDRSQQLLSEFNTHPADERIFRALEEQLYLDGDWENLAQAYATRLNALDPGRPQIELRLRLGGLLFERVSRPDQAAEQYRSVLAQDARHPEALTGLRRSLLQVGDVAGALQIAEIEEALERPDRERSRVLCEIADLWFELDSPDEAETRLRRALDLQPGFDPGLRGLAQVAELRGDSELACELHLQRWREGRGGAHRESVEQLARLLPDDHALLDQILDQAISDENVAPAVRQRLVDRARVAGRWDEADAQQLLLWEQLEPGPERADLALSAASALLSEGDQAERCGFWLQRASAARPDDPRVHQLRVRFFRRSGGGTDLLAALTELERLEGSSSIRLLEIAVLHEREGNLAACVECLGQLLEEDPRDAEALEILDRSLERLERHEERADVLTRRLDLADSDDDYTELATQLGDLCTAELADDAQAERHYQAALARSPGHHAPRERIKQLYYKCERYADLDALLEEAARREQSPAPRSKLWCELADLRANLTGETEAARDAYVGALEADPGCRQALNALRQMGPDSEADRVLLTACEYELSSSVKPARARELLAEIFELAERSDDLKRAEAAAQRWVDLAPDEASWRALADISRKTRNDSSERDALEALEPLLQDRDERAARRTRLGELYFVSDDSSALDRSAHWYEKALELKHDRVTHTRLVEIYQQTGQRAKLAEKLREALDVASADEEQPLRIQLARTLSELGDRSGARETLRPAFEADPSNDAIADVLEGFLAEQQRHDELVELLEQRLQTSRDPGQRRSLAHRLGSVLLDELDRAEDTVAALRELADPSRNAPLEELFERALQRAPASAELETWLVMRQAHVEPRQRVRLGQQLAQLQRDSGRTEEAVASLRSTQRSVPSENWDPLLKRLIELYAELGDLDGELDALASLAEHSGDPETRARAHVDRARRLGDSLGHSDEAAAELALIDSFDCLRMEQLRGVLALSERLGATATRADALQNLAQRTEHDEERISSLSELAELLSEGPEACRDLVRAESILRELSGEDGCDVSAFHALSALFERSDQTDKLVELIEARRGNAGTDDERASYSLRLASILGAAGRDADAAQALRTADVSGPCREAIDEMLYTVLNRGENENLVREHCEACARRTTVERSRWLRRWMQSLEKSGTPLEARLAALEGMLQQDPRNLDVRRLQFPLLRALGRQEALAGALEELLQDPYACEPDERRVALRELLRLQSGPLRNPEAALAVIDSELDAAREIDDEILAMATRLSRRSPLARREVRLLECVRDRGALPKDWSRRLGLAYAELGADEQATPLLEEVLGDSPRDRQTVEALWNLANRAGDADRELELFDAWFNCADGQDRANIPRLALRLAETRNDDALCLVWLRRWASIGGAGRIQLDRWLQLEKELGDRAGQLSALRRLRENSEDDNHGAALLAQEGDLYLHAGQFELARERFEEALRRTPQPPIPWLVSLDSVLESLGRTVRRSGVLRDLTRNPGLSVEEQMRYREVRIDLLSNHSELREEAAAELRKLIDSASTLTRERRIERKQDLLRIYGELHRIAEWCDLAEELLPDLEAADRTLLRHSLARRLTENGFARDRAIKQWKKLLEESPENLEARSSLAELLDFPGAEAERAEALEELARRQGNAAAPTWIAAAELRWQTLRDAEATANAITEAVTAGANGLEIHRLRIDVARETGDLGAEIASLRVLLASDDSSDATANRWLRLAEALHESQAEAGDVAAALDQALEHELDDASLRSDARRLLVRVGDYERGSELLRVEVDAAEGSERAHLLRELAHLQWDGQRLAAAACETYDELAAFESLNLADLESFADALARERRWSDHARRRREILEVRSGDALPEEWLDLARLALEQCDDAELARDACDRALELNRKLPEALSLRAELYATEGQTADQIEDLIALGEVLEDESAAAAQLSRAADLCSQSLGDDTRAWSLYRNALDRDGSQLDALLGAGEIAFARREWGEAERMFDRAAGLLESAGRTQEITGAAYRAAEAALEQHRDSEAFGYMEQCLAIDPENPEALDAMARLSLRLSAFERALDCLEQRLPRLDDADERVDCLLRIAQAAEGLQEPSRAISALTDVIRERASDELSRGRLVDLLEKADRQAEAVDQLDDWLALPPRENTPALQHRAARLELGLGRRQDARRRLETLTENDGAPSESWCELANLLLDNEGADAALALIERGLLNADGDARGELLAAQAQAYAEAERLGDAALSSVEALETGVRDENTVLLLTRNLGRSGDWRRAVAQLERVLDTSAFSAPVESEIWEAIGRAYAGPLEDIDRAERCYRRSLEANSQRAQAREALADITAFDPTAHAESVQLHRALLQDFPARPGSWRAIGRIAEHWKRTRAVATCEAVFSALRISDSDASPTATDERPLIHTGTAASAELRSACEILQVLNETDQLPEVDDHSRISDVPSPLRAKLVEIAGPGWELADGALLQLWAHPLPESLSGLADQLPRRRRKQLERSVKAANAVGLGRVEPDAFREELYAQAAARAVDDGSLGLDTALLALLKLWPETARLSLEEGGDLAAAAQQCPPARTFLLRVADTTLGSLGL